MRFSNQVRELVAEEYVKPARVAAKRLIRVSVSDLSRELEWQHRFPLICSALLAKTFHREMGVAFVEATTPCPSSTSILTFRLV